jgi:hypothetical protein
VVNSVQFNSEKLLRQSEWEAAASVRLTYYIVHLHIHVVNAYEINIYLICSNPVSSKNSLSSLLPSFTIM